MDDLDLPETTSERTPSKSDPKSVVNRFHRAQQDLVLQAADLSLRTVADMVGRGAIDIAPQFQRRDRWNHFRQSALIESFVLNIPVPPIYLAEDELGTYAIIDGKQRITTIASYLHDGFALKALNRFHDLENLKFSDLPRVIQNALDLRPLRSVTLLKQSDPDLKYEVFHRLNSGGEVLNAQEIRNVVFRGPLNRRIYGLAEHPFLRQQLKIEGPRSSAYRKMQDAEFVLRFMTLAHTWESFSGDLSLSMDEFLEENRSLPEPDLDRLAHRFNTALEACADIWGANAFQRPDGDGWRDQALAGMFDAQMVAIDILGDGVIRALIARRDQAIEAVRDLFGDNLFDSAVRQGTNTPSRVAYRISVMAEVLGALAS